MSIHAAATFFPSRDTATAGASMGQPATRVSTWLSFAGAEKDFPPSFESEIQIGRVSEVAPSRQESAGLPAPSSAIPGAQHSQSVEPSLTLGPGFPSTTRA